MVGLVIRHLHVAPWPRKGLHALAMGFRETGLSITTMDAVGRDWLTGSEHFSASGEMFRDSTLDDEMRDAITPGGKDDFDDGIRAGIRVGQ